MIKTELEAILSEIKLQGYQAYEAINFIDGRRSILEITKAVSAEYGPVEIQNVYGFLKILEKAELVRLVTLY
jgi:Fe2+ or Zn2+ uptake regulation protein